MEADHPETGQSSAQQSLLFIRQTPERNRQSMLRKGADLYCLWGALLVLFSLLVSLVWHYTGHPAWNFLWLAMPAVGYCLTALALRHSHHEPDNFLMRLLGNVWNLFCVFGVLFFLLAHFLVPMDLTLVLVLLLGFALSVSGLGLGKRLVTVFGLLIALIGAVLSGQLHEESYKMLIFTFSGLMLIATGLLVRFSARQDKR